MPPSDAFLGTASGVVKCSKSKFAQNCPSSGTSHSFSVLPISMNAVGNETWGPWWVASMVTSNGKPPPALLMAALATRAR